MEDLILQIIALTTLVLFVIFAICCFNILGRKMRKKNQKFKHNGSEHYQAMIKMVDHDYDSTYGSGRTILHSKSQESVTVEPSVSPQSSVYNLDLHDIDEIIIEIPPQSRYSTYFNIQNRPLFP
ncbi:hypothetical protein HDV06_005901 [Boothiomyces sp. JEL0866]|nr:hypothetical protein HDV06_005901 [Boothiomyces sp. JEL0866]